MPFDLPPAAKLWLPPKPAIVRPWREPITHASFLPGMFPGGAAATRAFPSVVFLDSAVSDANLTVYTFPGLDLGEASPTRFIVVSIGWAHSSPVSAISTVTIAGTGTAPIEASVSADSACALRGALVPSGTSGNVVVTFLGGSSACGVALWALYDLLSTAAHDTATSTADPAALDVNTLNKGVVIAAVHNGTGGTVTWTGVTEDYDEVIQAAASMQSGGSAVTTTETPRTISGNYSTSLRDRGVAASFR